jgi:hypothetical protein
MTEEIYNKATNLRSLIEKDKKALKYWKEAVDATEETITLSNGLGYNGYVKTSIARNSLWLNCYLTFFFFLVRLL